MRQPMAPDRNDTVRAQKDLMDSKRNRKGLQGSLLFQVYVSTWNHLPSGFWVPCPGPARVMGASLSVATAVL